jgi:hypothetical protein
MILMIATECRFAIWSVLQKKRSVLRWLVASLHSHVIHQHRSTSTNHSRYGMILTIPTILDRQSSSGPVMLKGHRLVNRLVESSLPFYRQGKGCGVTDLGLALFNNIQLQPRGPPARVGARWLPLCVVARHRGLPITATEIRCATSAMCGVAGWIASWTGALDCHGKGRSRPARSGQIIPPSEVGEGDGERPSRFRRRVAALT